MFHLLIPNSAASKHNLRSTSMESSLAQSIRWSTRHDSRCGNNVESFPFSDEIIQRDDDWMKTIALTPGLNAAPQEAPNVALGLLWDLSYLILSLWNKDKRQDEYFVNAKST